MKKTMGVMGTWLMAGMIGFGTYYFMNNTKKKPVAIKEINEG